MSRIGKKFIQIPDGAVITVAEDVVTVKGPKEELSFKINPEISVVVEEGFVKVTAKDSLKRLFPLWGLTRALIANMVEGVTKGFEQKLELTGVGYRAKQNGKDGVLLCVW